MDNRFYAVLVIKEAVIGGGVVAPVGASGAGLQPGVAVFSLCYQWSQFRGIIAIPRRPGREKGQSVFGVGHRLRFVAEEELFALLIRGWGQGGPSPSRIRVARAARIAVGRRRRSVNRPFPPEVGQRSYYVTVETAGFLTREGVITPPYPV